MSDLRSLHLRGALGAVRTEWWDGREHLVVPVVALQEAVIHAVNAKKPEYVPRLSLANSVGKWNGHPLVVGHPVRNGKQISAHDPLVLAQHGFGFIRSSMMNGTRLGMEAMVDVARLTALKHDQLLADLRAGKSIEVSVGAFVNTNDVKGTCAGKRYDGEWTEIMPDHLAFLPNGTGACSIAMGCGAHRAAMLVTAEGFEIERSSMPITLKDIKARILALFDTPEQLASEEQAESIGYATIRELLDQVGDSWDKASKLVNELIAAESDTYADEDAETEIERARLEAIRVLCMAMYGHLNSIMSTTMPKIEAESPRYMEDFRAAYGKTISAATMKTVQSAHDASHDMHSHTVGLGAACNGMKLLESVTHEQLAEFVALRAKECPTCNGTGQTKIDDKQQDCEACDGTGTLKTAAAITPKAAECGCKETTMTEQEQKALEAEIAALKAAASTQADELKVANAKQAETDAALRAAQSAQIPAEEVVKLRALAAERDTKDATEKLDLVAQLIPLKALTKEQLESRSLEDLRTMAAFAKVEAPVDYSSRGFPAPRSASNDDFVPPNPYDKGIKALQGALG